MITLEEFFAAPPSLHVHPGTHEPVFWGFTEGVLRHLASLVPTQGTTMETGAGMSTVYFAMCGFHHTAIAPDASLFGRILKYCEKTGVDTSKLTLVDAKSEDYLSRNDLPDLDLFLVDGCHSFPTPILDYYFGAKALKIGGHMVIDDTQIITGKILADYLEDDRHWEQESILATTAVYRKLDQGVHEDGWGRQVFCTNGRTITDPQPDDGPPSTSVLVSQAWASAEEGDFERVVELTDATVNHESVADSYDWLVVRVLGLRHLARYDEARTAILEACECAPRAPGARVERAWLEISTGNAPVAVDIAMPILELDGIDQAQLAQAYHVLGVALGESGRLDDALVSLDSAVEQGAASNNFWPRLHRSRVFFAQGRTADALQEIDQVLANAPDDPEAQQLKKQFER